MILPRHMLLGCLLLGLTFAVADQPSTDTPERVTAETYFPLTIGDKDIRVQLAILPSEQAQGLMFRQELGENDGMLFVFRKPGPRGFWMKNVDIPLDVGYILADGTLAEVYPMYPHVEESVKSKSDKIKIVLEMNQGWFAENGIKPGDKIDLAQAAAAMDARGYSAARYGLK
ncbi:DUF192 domain-containing protein [Cerasicoccus fimbriatus]|uniref:DUF192 domain-containing protein n=1 Tax=Cerasicoccus fimbriatus TaxID=3014554 RepID=UPI0022B3DE90|nr:DUF192 domain-containing protein [Cerasicoccus sp. TK19100]